MPTYNDIPWLAVGGGLTGLGLVLSYFVMRRRGLRAGLRGAAWSLLPLAAYLTGSIKMFWKMGAAIGTFAKGFVFSTEVWSGIAVAGLAFVLLVSTGGVRRRRQVKSGDTRQTAAGTGTSDAIAPRAGTVPAAGTAVAAAPAGRTARQAASAKGAAGDAGDDDMKDIEEILRRRGIS